MIDKRKEIGTILNELGIYPNLLGYKYIIDAIQICVNDVKINSIHKQIYPDIGNRYDTEPSRVERAIRHAISISWTKKYIQYHDIFRNYYKRPKNKELIYTIADRIRFI